MLRQFTFEFARKKNAPENLSLSLDNGGCCRVLGKAL